MVNSKIAVDSELEKGQKIIKILDYEKKIGKLVLGERALHLESQRKTLLWSSLTEREKL